MRYFTKKLNSFLNKFFIFCFLIFSISINLCLAREERRSEGVLSNPGFYHFSKKFLTLIAQHIPLLQEPSQGGDPPIIYFLYSGFSWSQCISNLATRCCTSQPTSFSGCYCLMSLATNLARMFTLLSGNLGMIWVNIWIFFKQKSLKGFYFMKQFPCCFQSLFLMS